MLHRRYQITNQLVLNVTFLLFFQVDVSCGYLACLPVNQVRVTWRRYVREFRVARDAILFTTLVIIIGVYAD